jgi:3-carboxy-cis,cis-muconate cycloisomerase
MPFAPGDSLIFGSSFSTPEIAEIFSDEHYIRCLLEVESALARVESRLGIIPAVAGEEIAKAIGEVRIDFEKIREGVEKDGFPVIELVRQIRQAAGKQSAEYVHFAATTQDIMDTGLILQLRIAIYIFSNQLHHLITKLAEMASKHRSSLMAGRTHAQQALPITFGYKVAGWLAPLQRDLERLDQLKPRLLVVQFGGAAGTLAVLGKSGLDVQAAFAKELELNRPSMPWHTQRDNLVELADWLALVSGSLAKMAQDILLLAQSEVGEVRESADGSRGGSSSMPQKSNPIISELIVAAARANAGHLANMHQAMINEHERGTHAWQLEWLNLPQMIALTASALQHACWLSEHLQVDTSRMKANVRNSRGVMLAEELTAALSGHISLSEARQLVSEAARKALQEQRHLVDILREEINLPLDWDKLRDEANYLGAAEDFVDLVVRSTLPSR